MKLDPDTGNPVVEKASYEDRIFRFNFGPKLGTNTISTANSVTATAQGKVTQVGALTVGTPAIDGYEVTVALSVGTDGEDYLLECKCTDSASNDLSEFMTLKVRG